MASLKRSLGWIYNIPGLLADLRFFRFLSILVFAAGVSFADSQGPSSEINFGRNTKDGLFVTAKELETWGLARNFHLRNDSPLKNIQDYEANYVPTTGLSFDLLAPGNSRSYLYLDLVTFQPGPRYNLLRVQWLEIQINGRVKKTIYFGGGSFFESPVRITIDREEMMDRIVHVYLRPSPGDDTFAIWDAFVSPIQEDMNPMQDNAF